MILISGQAMSLVVTKNAFERSADGFICLPMRIPRGGRAWEKGVSVPAFSSL